jgi:hypothetical protein
VTRAWPGSGSRRTVALRCPSRAETRPTLDARVFQAPTCQAPVSREPVRTSVWTQPRAARVPISPLEVNPAIEQPISVSLLGVLAAEL